MCEIIGKLITPQEGEVSPLFLQLVVALIEKNLSYDEQTNQWIVEYPWIKDPIDLPDNRKVALAMLASTERRLAKNPVHAKVYDNQVKDTW